MESSQPGQRGEGDATGPSPKGTPSWQIGPRSAGKILDLSFNLYFGNIAKLLAASAVVVVPLTVLLIVLFVVAFGEPGAGAERGLVDVGSHTRVVDYDLYNVIAVVSQVIWIVGYLIIIGASFTAANRAYMDEEVDVRGSVQPAINKLHSILWVTILTVLAALVGVLALIVGAIYAVVVLAVAIPVLMVEDIRGFGACRRSFRLVKDNFWRTLGVLFVAGIFTGLLTLIAGLIEQGATGLAEDQINLYVVIAQVVQGIALAFTASFSAVVSAVLYYDLRIRKEGFDIERLAGEGEAGTPPGSPPPGNPPPLPPAPGA